MTKIRTSRLLGVALLAACSAEQANVNPRTITPTIVLTNQTAGRQPPPSGPSVSVIDSLELRVTSENGESSVMGRRLGRYNTTATLQPSFPPGNTTFVAEVFSNNRTSLFTGTTTQLITSDVLSLVLNVAPTKPVLLMVPDTAKTNTITSTVFSVYNAGIGSLAWNVTTTDTAFTRCGAQCTISPTSGTSAAAATTTFRVTVPTNFPTRRFAFVVRSTEGNVNVFWDYDSSPISSVAIQPTASLHNIGQAFPLASVVQASGSASTAVTWRSSNTAVATVNGSGSVTGVSRGFTTVVATSSIDTAKKASADVRVYDSTAAVPSWVMVQPAGPDTVRRDDTSPGSKSSIVLRAQAAGALATEASPFTAVEFWVRPGSVGAWRRIGQVSQGVVGTDGTGNRAWSWSFTWNPDATDAPFVNPSTTGMSILAIGLVSSGQTIATPPSQNVFLRVP